jgi:hypothetical protein
MCLLLSLSAAMSLDTPSCTMLLSQLHHALVPAADLNRSCSHCEVYLSYRPSIAFSCDLKRFTHCLIQYCSLATFSPLSLQSDHVSDRHLYSVSVKFFSSCQWLLHLAFLATIFFLRLFLLASMSCIISSRCSMVQSSSSSPLVLWSVCII